MPNWRELQLVERNSIPQVLALAEAARECAEKLERQLTKPGPDTEVMVECVDALREALGE